MPTASGWCESFRELRRVWEEAVAGAPDGFDVAGAFGAIVELGVDVMLDPGQTKTVVIHPSAGEGDFTYVSTAPGGDGMTGTLTFYI